MNLFTVIYPNGTKHGLYRYKDDAAKEAHRLTRNTGEKHSVKACDIMYNQSTLDRIK